MGCRILPGHQDGLALIVVVAFGFSRVAVPWCVCSIGQAVDCFTFMEGDV